MRGRSGIIAVGAATMLLTACPPATPPPVDPMACTRTVRTIGVPSHQATYPRIGADGKVGVYTVDDGTGPPLPTSLGLFSASLDVYRYDGVTDSSTRINPLGTTSTDADVNRDGSVVVFATVTTSFFSTAEFGIDVWTRADNSITRITGAAGGHSLEPVVSGDGRYVAFVSDATTLIGGDPDVNANLDVFVYDRTTSTMRRLTDQTVPWQTLSGFFGPSSLRISEDGSTVIVARYRNDNQHGELLSIDRASGATTVVADLLSSPSPDPQAPGPLLPFIIVGDPSADGSVVAFATATTVPGIAPDANGGFDTFVWNRATGATTQLTFTPLSLPIGAGPLSLPAAVSGTGRYVTVTSTQADPADHTTDPPVLVTPGLVNTYLYDRQTSAWSAPIASTFGRDASRDAAATVGTTVNSVVVSFCA